MLEHIFAIYQQLVHVLQFTYKKKKPFSLV